MRRKGYRCDKFHPDDRPIRLYVFESAGLFKVGLAANIKHRLRQLRSSSPFPVNFAASRCVRADAAGAAEHMAHLLLGTKHSHGEWFSCDRLEAISAIVTAARRANAAAMKAAQRPLPPPTPEDLERLLQAEEERLAVILRHRGIVTQRWNTEGPRLVAVNGEILGD